MSFFASLKKQAARDPKIVVLPEYEQDKDGVLGRAIELAGPAVIPVPLTKRMMQGKLREFAEYYSANISRTTTAVAEKLLQRYPVVFACLMVKLGYAHALAAGRYTKSSGGMRFINPVIEEERGRISSALFFREPPPEYPVFSLMACADMAVTVDPDPDQL